MREINLNRQLLGLEDLEFGTGTVEQTRAGTKVNITRINAGNLPFDETRTLLEFTQAVNIEELGNSVEAINNLNNDLDKILIVEDNLPEVISVAQNIVPNLTEILNVDTLASQVTQDKSDVSSMKLAVETLYDTFDDRFLGTKTVDQTLDNDGNALIDGAMYFNTSSNTMKVYDVGTTTWYSMPQIYLSALLDVNLTSITSGNVLRWNGTKWVNYSLSKADVGLNLVDNTSDSSKPVSTAVQTALNLKANLDSPAFTGTPTAPNPILDDNSTQLATTEFVKAKSEGDSIGIGQTWQNVTASRSAMVTYTNNTGKPICVSIYFSNNIAQQCSLSVTGILVDAVGSAGWYTVSTIVPSGKTYYFSASDISQLIIGTWAELR